MYLDKLKLTEHMNLKHSGSYRKFARELQVEPAQLHKILTKDANAGTVFLGRLHAYCKKVGLRFDDFIFFE
ncbi:hypothetical protein JMA_27480 [Jeotgalibacillus malaysiensis]|uniref:HTH cro/C1-type domain-containing protein n=1 Tax=Jeotgalibacillus malaysiensis TaxID=1508404 RepID=A0A0B5AP64_9BACL|nr:hypothetical protein [Jeotgalibacillus malaysiensis]AJD92065.1 hypothetical protein JMA_27480 [Jeotgalibacillus malaysiensis]